MPAFSGKQKKKQLQERRQRKQQAAEEHGDGQRRRVTDGDHRHGHDGDRSGSRDEHGDGGVQVEYKYGADRKGIRSVFLKETADEVAARKKRSYEPLAQRRFMDDNGIPFGSWFDMPGHTDAALMPFSVELPTRGWTLTAAAATALENNNSTDNDDACEEGRSGEGPPDNAALEASEEARFQAYLHAVDNYPLPAPLRTLQLSSHERNLDVWRQLWRTVEQSDVVVIVCDIRYPILHLPLSLLRYIVRQSRKPALVLLNKADLVPRPILDGWMQFLPRYFHATGVVSADAAEAAATGVVCDIPLLPFTSLPAAETAFGAEEAGNAAKRRKKQKRRTKLYEQLRTGKLQVAETPTGGNNNNDDDDDAEGSGGSSHEEGAGNDSPRDGASGEGESAYAVTDNFKGMHKAERELQHDRRGHKELQIVSDMISALLQRCRELGEAKSSDLCGGVGGEAATLHIGVVGHPNVGKSSLLNCIRGTKVVSVSATPGHTKHLQTIPIPSERVVLIDSPGLALPVFGVPRPLQAVVGTHQIAQTRDPQSGVAFLASHLQLERLYGLRKVEGADEAEAWSPYELCESYAKKKGYFVKHGKGALDVHRGAIEILQEAYEGRLVLFFAPPDAAWLQSTQFREEVRPFLLLEVQLPETAGE
ncbi:putative GTP-binding protein [Trypanosoma conorhini]|uniref:Guanine nucleotide-binding protein-like 1 n=1 Tax=Trypanosoma conorhini TaxID=83891 RepID=A0A422PJY7_9TRYP|nr:putative GTP-binding protein [Trypanosoma conorhini]RNF18015.1 putative GTP-binding protein [Trypanosoma conorhini]